MSTTTDEKDSILRVLNNAALAKYALSKGDTQSAKKHIDRALSWSEYFFKTEHPSAGKIDHSLPPQLLCLEDAIHTDTDR